MQMQTPVWARKSNIHGATLDTVWPADERK